MCALDPVRRPLSISCTRRMLGSGSYVSVLTTGFAVKSACCRLFEHAVYELHGIVVGRVRMRIGPALLSVRFSTTRSRRTGRLVESRAERRGPMPSIEDLDECGLRMEIAA